MGWASGGGSSPLSRAKVYRATAYSVPGAETPVPWDGEEYDTDGYHDNTTNPSRFTVPFDGLYLLGGGVAHSTQSIARFLVQIKKNGTAVRGSAVEVYTSGVGTFPAPLVGALDYATAGQYFEMVTIVTGANPALDTAKAGFWIVRLSG